MTPYRKPWPTTIERFWSKFDRHPSGCWIWNAATTVGYGVMKAEGKREKMLAHRYSYELFWGPIPEGLEIDHLCRTPACVNPAHLEAVTHRENDLRGVGFVAINARKTHCKYGHPFDDANTYRTRQGYRRCRACNKIWTRKRARAKAEAQAA